MSPSSSSAKPNIFWRDGIRRAMPQAPAGEREFYDYCVPIYAEEKRVLEETITRGASEREMSGARAAVYVIAMALLTYGRLDVIDDILKNQLPHPHPTNRGLSGAINQLIPIPADLRAGTSPLEALAWIRANEARLRWNEDAGRFVLEESPTRAN